MANAETLSGYADRAALDRFAAAIDVATYEFENIPLETVEHLAARVPVRPGPQALAVCQDRLAEKDFVTARGIPTAPYRPVPDEGALAEAVAAIGLPAVLKTTRMGYDGKAQAMLRSEADLAGAWQRIGGRPAILEGFVEFRFELSVIAARGADGTVVCYPPVRNEHENHILARTTAPADLPPRYRGGGRGDRADPDRGAGHDRRAGGRDVLGHRRPAPGQRAGAAAAQLRPLDDRGLPRQPVRTAGPRGLRAAAGSGPAVPPGCDGQPDRRPGRRLAPASWAEPGAHLHLYGKTQARPGRKMGHVTRVVDEQPEG